MNKYIQAEIKKAFEALPDVSVMRESNVLVTGGTGLLGSNVIRLLAYINEKNGLDINIYGMARSEEKVNKLGLPKEVMWLYQDMSAAFDQEYKFDYIIHTASPTDSKYFTTNPVETINETVQGINNILRAGIGSKGIVSISSMEIYGICLDDRYLVESDAYKIDHLNIRNSYSEGKRMLECLCASYASEYQVPVKIVRLCQTFGPGITENDNRVFAQFGKKVLNHEDIVLATKGETKRSYCSVADALSGIFVVLLQGKNGEAYNLASDNSYYSIYEMAELFVKGTNSKIIIEEQNDNKYLETLKFGLNTDKIKAIGYKSNDNFESIVKIFLSYYQELV